MKSSIDVLEEICVNLRHMSLGHDGSGLYRAGWYAGIISDIFQKNNNVLSESWLKVDETCKKVDNSIRVELENVIKDLEKFIDQTKLNENVAVVAANKANEAAHDVLSQLGISNLE